MTKDNDSFILWDFAIQTVKEVKKKRYSGKEYIERKIFHLMYHWVQKENHTSVKYYKLIQK